MVQTRARVLVVDDEESIRNVLREGLADEGHDVLLASTGEQALELLGKNGIEAMLLDIRMPGLSGLDVLSEVLVRSPDTCVIMVTAIGDVSTAVNAMKKGAYDYLAKPFDLDEVTMAVQRALERRTLMLLDRQHKRELEERLGEQEERLHEQFAQLIGSLAREHDMVLTMERVHNSKRRGTNGASALPEELRSPAGGVARYVEALRAAIRSGSLSAR